MVCKLYSMQFLLSWHKLSDLSLTNHSQPLNSPLPAAKQPAAFQTIVLPQPTTKSSLHVTCHHLQMA